MGLKFHYFFSTGAEPAEPAEINDQSGGLGARARAGADPLCALILLDKYIYILVYITILRICCCCWLVVGWLVVGSDKLCRGPLRGQ